MTGMLSNLKSQTSTKNKNNNAAQPRTLTLFKGLTTSRLTNIAGLSFVVLLLASLLMLYVSAHHARQHSAYIKAIMQIYHHIGQLNLVTAPQGIDEIELLHTKWQDDLNQLGYHIRLLQQGGQFQNIGIKPTIELLSTGVFESFERQWRATEIHFQSALLNRDALIASILPSQSISANTAGHVESVLGDATALPQLSDKLTPEDIAVRRRFQASLAASQKLIEPLSNVENGVTSHFQDLQNRDKLLITSLLVLMVIAAVLFIRSFSSNLRNKLLQGKQDVEHTQQAILRLLNEMEKPTDGDLTARMSVTESITGTIADAINLTIEELQGLVKKVDYASTHVINTSVQAEKISSDLLAAAQTQSQKIEVTTITVLGIAESLETVSRSANACAEVSRQSLQAAESGALAVQDAINGMNEIRTYIQETAKRIKRLGESSQEIGEIVTLISDITEQTNVLALNAAIQAASAGEAGKGFSVIAQEIQRLAEHSAEATKQISTLIRNIRGDTQDTIIAMERSTAGVVEGTRRANATGDALEEIETVSKQLAQLVAEISTSTQKQTLITSEIAESMENILAITRQTTEGTTSNAESVKQIAEHAARLKTSIARFKV